MLFDMDSRYVDETIGRNVGLVVRLSSHSHNVGASGVVVANGVLGSDFRLSRRNVFHLEERQA
jgi:hypothetical protein